MYELTFVVSMLVIGQFTFNTDALITCNANYYNKYYIIVFLTFLFRATDTAFIFGNDIRAYLCIELHRISEHKYYYFMGTSKYII